MKNHVPLTINSSENFIFLLLRHDGQSETLLGDRESETRGPRALVSTFSAPWSGGTKWTPLELSHSSTGQKRKMPYPHVQIRPWPPWPPCPRPPVTHTASAATQPHRHLGSCHVSRGAGGTLAASEGFFLWRQTALPDPRGLAMRGYPNRSHAS